MKSLSNKILAINCALIILAIFIYFLIADLEYSDDLLYFGLFIVLIFGLSAVGIGAGIVENKYNIDKVKFGIIGNSFLMIIIFSMFMIAIESPG